jgi:hypothetical protein
MTFFEKVKTLEKLAELGGEDRLIDQTLSKLLWYAEERARKVCRILLQSSAPSRSSSAWIQIFTLKNSTRENSVTMRNSFAGMP